MPQAVGIAIASLVGAGGISAAAATTIGTFAINVGLGLASTALSLIMAPKVESKPSEAQQEIKQPLAPRTKSYGRVRKSGTVFWFDTDPASRSSRRELYMGLALNHGRIDGFDAYFIDDNEVVIDGSGTVTTEPYGGNVVLTTKLGAPVETAYSALASKFNMPNMRGDGVASILGMFRNSSDANNQMERYPGGLPQLRVTMRASVCFDPREPSHDVNDQSTWTWSENLGVIILNYLIDPDGYGIPYSKIEANLDQWIEQLNICDEDVPLKSFGTEKRYRGAGTYNLTERPRDVVGRMEAACDGRVWQKRDGSIGFLVGRFTEPTVTIENKDILSYSIEHGQDALTAVAGLRAQFMSPDHDYREHDAEPWPSGEEVLSFDEDRVAALDLLWAPSHGQCRRIMKRQYLRQRAAWRGTISTNLAGLRAIDERYIRVVIDAFGIDESFEVGKFTLDPSTLRCQIEIVSVGAEIDEWDADTEESGGAPAVAREFRALKAGANQNAATITIPACDVGTAESGRHVFAFVSLLFGGSTVTFPSATIGGVTAKVHAFGRMDFPLDNKWYGALISAPLSAGATADVAVTMSGSRNCNNVRCATWAVYNLQSDVALDTVATFKDFNSRNNFNIDTAEAGIVIAGLVADLPTDELDWLGLDEDFDLVIPVDAGDRVSGASLETIADATDFEFSTVTNSVNHRLLMVAGSFR